jgi:hypothetical protein
MPTAGQAFNPDLLASMIAWQGSGIRIKERMSSGVASLMKQYLE